METNIIGIVLVNALIENNKDVEAAADGRIPESEVRRLEVHDARIDTGATYVSMPMRLINQLGLRRIKTVVARAAAGSVSFRRVRR